MSSRSRDPSNGIQYEMEDESQENMICDNQSHNEFGLPVGSSSSFGEELDIL